jgi:seryl-tRNA synthetase
MHDIRVIREDPAAFDHGLARRGLGPVAAGLLQLDERRRALLTEVQTLQARRNEASKAIGQAKAKKDEETAATLMAEVAAIKDRTAALDHESSHAQAELDAALAALPNLPVADVPAGEDEDGNVEQSRWGTPRDFAFAPRDHADLGPPLGLDFEAGAAISGARFTVLRGKMARLHRALGQYMLDTQSGVNGYEETAPPLLVRDEAVFGTAQLPKFAEDLFRTLDGRWLIPTAEVSLTNLVREQILPAQATDRTHPMLSIRSRRGRTGHARPDPPAPVREGRTRRHRPSGRIGCRA